MVKIVIIGAGSVEFTRNILADLCSYQELHGQLEIRLHDIDHERLAYAERAADQIIARTGAGYTVEALEDRRRAFDGADYLINEIQVGGYAATLADFNVPKRYGLRQTIADTIGIGGIFRGLRTIPVVNAMAVQMAEVCPDGLLLNYTNPMAMVPWGVYEGTPFKNVLGICHSVRDTHAFLSATVGIAEEHVRFVTAGFNHQAFVYEFQDRRTGEDLYPRLLEIVEADPEGLGRRTRVEIFKRFGFFPTESSEHSSEYVPWFIHHDSQIDRFRIPIDDYILRSDDNLAEWQDIKSKLDAGQELEIELNDELAAQIILAIETGVPLEVYTNVRNEGRIQGLPDEACVEVPTLVDKDGAHPESVGRIPAQTLALNRTFLNVVELTVRAVLEQNLDFVYQAALMDPNTAATLTTSQIAAMVDDLIAAHGDLIPEGIRRG
jgi:alpha-galactosidase